MEKKILNTMNRKTERKNVSDEKDMDEDEDTVRKSTNNKGYVSNKVQDTKKAETENALDNGNEQEQPRHAAKHTVAPMEEENLETAAKTANDNATNTHKPQKSLRLTPLGTARQMDMITYQRYSVFENKGKEQGGRNSAAGVRSRKGEFVWGNTSIPMG